VPAPNVRVPYEEFLGRTQRHTRVVAGLATTEVRVQRLVAELVMMRMFDELMESIAGAAYRLACGAPYDDGTAPVLLTQPASSTTHARTLFENENRTKLKFVKWSNATFINRTTQHVLDPSDSFSTSCSRHGGIMAEMQSVRNRIAHRGGNARTSYAKVVKRRYGADLNHITPGVLLLSPRFQPPLIEQYLASARVIAKDCIKA
jgi:hypothetical protein